VSGKNWLLSVGEKLAFKCREKIGGKKKNSGQKPSNVVKKAK